ncbi:MAG TPA: carboxypeptidase regulatory-like domain-containing protein [Pyrinomonadaceae bacterium]|jgi:hypothetical protein
MIKKFGLHALLVLLATGLLTVVSAQTSTVGSISGTVRDPQGGAVSKVEVTIVDEATGQTRTVTTDDDGFFSAPSIAVGRYSVSAAPQGFKKTVATGVDVHVSERVVVDLTLEVGQVSETVTVTGAAQLVETRSGNVSSLVSEKQVTELPLNGRNYAQLALMVPGVSPVTQNGSQGAFRAGGTGLASGVDMSVNGNGSNQNMWTVDGVNNMDVGSNRTLLVFPSIDSIQEFRVERNSFSAEFGQAQGAVINLVTKGGSNDFHGSLFEFFRNDKLNANDYFINAAADPSNLDKNGKAKRPALRYNNFGGNFSGPIIKNRVFFFWSEEWRRERRGLVRTARVPTAAERVGDFSGNLTSTLPHLPGAGPCTTPGPNPTDPDCFPGNRIPANQLSPVALSLLKVYPDPNVGNGTGSGNNWIAAPKAPTNTRQDLIRGDVTITNNMNLMVRWINEKWVQGAPSTFWGDSPFPTVDSDWAQPSKSFAVKLTNTLNSTSVNEFQFSRAGNDIFITTNPRGQALNDEIVAKFPTVFPQSQGLGYPTFWGGDGYAALWHQAPWTNHEDLFIWKDDFSKVVGDHDLKFGVLFSHNVKDETNVGSNEVYQFCGTNTRTGNILADLLVKDLPLGCYTERDQQEFVLGRWRDQEFYVNDTWKLNRRVTLNLGMRYSRYGAPYSDNDRISNFIPERYDGSNPLSALVQAGQNGFSRSIVNTYGMGFQPRVGLAWDIKGDGKTAVRLGFGRYLSRGNVIPFLLRESSNPPWSTIVNTNWGGSSTSLADDPTFRSLDTINPGLRNAASTVTATTPFNAVNQDFQPPESWQWNLTVSREVMKNTVVEASYIGNRGLHLWRLMNNWNDVVPSARLPIAQAVRNNATNVQALIDAGRRLPGVGAITMDEFTGDSNYHAFQLWVNRRFTDRLAFQISYTWGHNITNVPTTSYTAAVTDPFNYDLDRGDSDLDRRQMLVANAVYALPSFKRWGSFASHVLGDWQVNTIISLLGGTPIDILSGANTAGLANATSGQGGQRPNLVPGVPLYLKNSSNPLQYLNPAAFSLPAVGQFGNLGRGVLRAPAVHNVDFSIAKNWRMRERYGLQFRAEMFNAFNHTNFNGLNTTLSFNNVAEFANDPCNGRGIRPDGATSQCGVALNAANGSFGTLNSNRGPREIQFGLKFSF